MKTASGCEPNTTPLTKEVIAHLEHTSHAVADFGGERKF